MIITNIDRPILMTDAKGTCHEVMPVNRTFEVKRDEQGVAAVFVEGTDIRLIKTTFDQLGYTVMQQLPAGEG